MRNGLTASLAAVGVLALVDFPLHKPAVSFVLVWNIGSVLALIPASSRRQPRALAPWACGLMALASAGALFFGLGNTRAAIFASAAQKASAHGEWPAAIELFGRAHAWSLGNFRYARSAGDFALRRSAIPINYRPFLVMAYNWFNTATRDNPRDAESFLGLGRAAEGLGRHGEAEEAYRMAIALDPAFGRSREFLGAFLLRQGRTEEGVRAYLTSRSTGLEPVIPEDVFFDLVRNDGKDLLIALVELSRAGHLRPFGRLCVRLLDNAAGPGEVLEAGVEIERSGNHEASEIFYRLAARRFKDSGDIRRMLRR